MKKYLYNNNDIENFYIKNGYIIIKNSINKNFFTKISKKILNQIHSSELKFKKIKNLDYQTIANEIINNFENSKDYEDLIFQEKIKFIMRRLIGNDLCVLNYTALWINAPTNTNPVLNKNAHVDAWTGTSINTLFLKLFITDCDLYNGITVYPGTHLHGLYPVKNRTIDFENFNIKLDKGLNLSLKKGDVLIWHPLLVHSTTGHSKKNKRVSMTLRYTSTENEFSSQERALGYKTISVGANNTIKRYIGNDGLQPFRIYGGSASVDKRLAKLYYKK
jgi:ectoine hydroxylase-related dioxygenase (phytanoyl-CoA dioxygenase family)